MITKTILIRINPASNGFSVVLTNHNIPGAENRQEVVKTTFEEVQGTIADFLTGVAETERNAKEHATAEKTSTSPAELAVTQPASASPS